MAPSRQLPCLLIGWLALCAGHSGSAQEEFVRGRLSDATSIELVDSAALNHLNRVSEYLASQQWENAVGTLRRVGEQYGDGLVKVEGRGDSGAERLSAGWYVSIRQYCQMRLAALPPEALRLYREQVDDAARRAFDAAARARDRRALRRLLQDFFCSSVGDQALLLLGDLALEAGDYAEARDAWSRMTPIEWRGNKFAEVPKPVFENARRAPGPFAPEAALLDTWYRADPNPPVPDKPETHMYRLLTEKPLPADVERSLIRFWCWHGLITVLKYPDTRVPMADIDARLVLASIMEGAADRAQRSLREFTELHPTAQGTLGGKRVTYAAALAELFEASASWPKPASTSDWRTFAGAPDRNGVRPGEIDVQGKPWKIDLPKLGLPANWISKPATFRQRRVAEDDQQPLSFLPVIAKDKVLVCSEAAIYAFHLWDGSSASPISKRGLIYPVPTKKDDGTEEAPTAMPREPFAGAPRFTLTVQGDKVLARIGTPLTAAMESQFGQKVETKIVCLDLSDLGRVVWEQTAQDDWSFEGPPISDGARVYVAQRRRGASQRARVVCYDAETLKGHEPVLRWQRAICAADTPSRGEMHECTHNLLTLHQGTLYYNTNLGVVAAIDAQDGGIQWLAAYRRAKPREGSAPAFFYRDLNPCLYHNGMLYVAPSDFDGILAIRAATGQIVAADLERTADTMSGATAVHLLGAVGDHLLASGDKLYWFDIGQALLKGDFRMSGKEVDLPAAYGRGVIVGDKAYVPLRDRIDVFDALRPGARAPHPIALSALHPGVTGGHLIVSDTHLLVAGTTALYGFELSRPLSSYRPPAPMPMPAASGLH